MSLPTRLHMTSLLPPPYIIKRFFHVIFTLEMNELEFMKILKSFLRATKGYKVLCVKICNFLHVTFKVHMKIVTTSRIILTNEIFHMC